MKRGASMCEIKAQRMNMILRREFYPDDPESGMIDALIAMRHLCDIESLDFDKIQKYAEKWHAKEFAECESATS